MPVVNKILNGLILITACAACIFSYFLHQQRIELRERANYLSKIIVKNAKVIDSKDELSTEIGISQTITEKKLNWQTYKEAKEKDLSKWETQVDEINKATELLATLKQDLAKEIVALNQKFELDEVNEDSLNSVLTYQENLKLINVSFDTLKAKQVTILSHLNSNSILNGSNTNISFNQSSSDIQQSLEKMNSKTNELMTQKNLMASSLNDLNKDLATKDGEILFSPSWQKLDFNRASPDEIRQGFLLIQSDFNKFNKKLYELTIANKQLEEQRSQLAIKENVIQDLNNENDELKNNHGRMKAEVARLRRDLEEREQLLSKKLPADLNAKVVEVNDRFNFFIIDKGRNNGLVRNANLIIHNNGAFVCKAVVTKVLKGQAVCDILPNPVSKELKLPTTGFTAVPLN
ncbi:MAG: hypothetical protein NE330_19225 [Lentisphaeraceae bacterium]|nr:hypothetical protein [Lentisphaeraceae bacterium]